MSQLSGVYCIYTHTYILELRFNSIDITYLLSVIKFVCSKLLNSVPYTVSILKPQNLRIDRFKVVSAIRSIISDSTYTYLPDKLNIIGAII